MIGLVSATIHGFRMMSHVFVLFLYPLQDMNRGVRTTEHTEQYSFGFNNFSENEQIMAVDVIHHLVVRD